MYDSDTFPNGVRLMAHYSSNTVTLLQLGGGTNSARSATSTIFYTATNKSANGTEKMRLDANGKLMVGGTTADAKFAVIDASNPDIAMRYNGTSGGHNTRLMFMDKRGVINAQVANNLQDDGSLTDSRTGEEVEV